MAVYNNNWVTKEKHISSEYFHRTVWRPWAKHFILNVLFALIVEKSLPTLHSIWKTDCPTAKKIGMNCSPPNVSHVGFLLKLETVGLRLLITTTIANALTAHYAKRTSKEKVSLSRLVNHFVKAMPGWESDSILHQHQPKLYIELWAFLSTPHLLRRKYQDLLRWKYQDFSEMILNKQVCEWTKKMWWFFIH